jgi:hypothetical protein
MYQPYPSGGQQDQPRPAPPRSILAAVKIMYVGAVLSAVGVVLGVVTIGSLRAAIYRAHPLMGAHRVHSLEVQDVSIIVVVGVLGIALWLWMATANKAGSSRARTIATVIFALNVIAVLIDLIRPVAMASKIAGVVICLAGLAAVVLLWQRDSSQYYDASARNQLTSTS